MENVQFIGDASDPFIFHPLLVLRTPRLPLTNKMELDDQFLESIYLASPLLYKETIKRNFGNISEKKTRLDQTLLKYFLRSSNRCTPFALFAGCSVVPWGPKRKNGKIILNENNIERFARLDIDYLFKLVNKFIGLKEVKDSLLFYTNNSIYPIGDELRYIEFSLENGTRQYQISSVKNTSELAILLKTAENGTKLSQLLLLLEDYDPQEANKYISDLVDAQLLVSELQPKLTGEDYLKQIICALKKPSLINNPEIKNYAETLTAVQSKLDDIKSLKNDHVVVYKEITELVKNFEIPVDEINLFQVDMLKHIEDGSLGENIGKKLKEVLIALNKLSLKATGTETGISKFCKDFNVRYGDRTMPLLQVLDPELGIGYNSGNELFEAPLLRLIEKKTKNKKDVETIHWTKVEQLLFQKLKKENQNLIEINETDLEGLVEDWESLPASMSILFKVVDSNKEILQIESVGGSSASNLLGRFGHLSKELNKLISDIADWEKHIESDKILAEVVHQPEDRICNVMIRPASHAYEVPYLAHSSLDNEHQLNTNDLFVSIKNNQVCLTSKKLGKEVLPRMGNAHNFKRNDLPVYRFLCDLQNQGKRASLNFNWGSLQKIYKNLPRVVFNNNILAPAQWVLTKEDLSCLTSKMELDVKKSVEKIRKKMGIPDCVLLSEGDNQLVVNFNDILSLDVFIVETKGKDQILLKEFISQDNGGVVDRSGNSYANEFICSVFNNKKIPVNNIKIEKVEFKQDIKRDFVFGSEWSYYKIYCGKKIADKILIDAIKPLTQELFNLGIIDKWFFIRYSDPEFHLRLRFHLTDINKIGCLIGCMNRYLAMFLDSGHIWRLQTDMYSREIERYGSEYIEMAESLFYFDSAAFLDMLELAIEQDTEKTRWLYIIKSIDYLLGRFSLNAETKEKLVYVLFESFAKEHLLDKKMNFQLDTTYRKWKADMWQILDKSEHNSVNQAVNAYLTYDHVIFPLTKRIIDNNKNIEQFLHSVVHMMVNRVMVTEHRLHELVIYHFLYQYYHSKNAIKKKANSGSKILLPVL